MGIGVEKDEGKALEWYKKSALQGDVTAQYSAGLIFLKIDSPQVDYVEGIAYLLLSSFGGEKKADMALETVKKYLNDQTIMSAKKRGLEIGKEITENQFKKTLKKLDTK
jgi:TPR repeat protein